MNEERDQELENAIEKIREYTGTASMSDAEFRIWQSNVERIEALRTFTAQVESHREYRSKLRRFLTGGNAGGLIATLTFAGTFLRSEPETTIPSTLFIAVFGFFLGLIALGGCFWTEGKLIPLEADAMKLDSAEEWTDASIRRLLNLEGVEGYPENPMNPKELEKKKHIGRLVLDLLLSRVEKLMPYIVIEKRLVVASAVLLATSSALSFTVLASRVSWQ